MTSLVFIIVILDGATQEKKPRQQAQLLVLVLEVLAMKKNQDDELHLVVLV
jgi:hypothetical protein